MPFNWEDNWTWVRAQYVDVEQAAEALSGLMQRNDSPLGEKAAALRKLADKLCIFLSRCRDAGILDALGDEGAQASDGGYRDYILGHLEEVIRREIAVLDLVGVDSKWSEKTRRDLEGRLHGAVGRNPIEAGAWKKRVRKAVDEVCSVPTSLIGDVANRIQPLAERAGKGVKIARWVVVGVANSLVVLKVPEPFTVSKVSKAIAYMMIASDT